MIELSQIKKEFSTDYVRTNALAGVDLTINRGEFVAIMGPSGCGKSTLLGVMGLIERPSSGEYRLDGEPVATLSEAKAAKRRAEKIGFIFQQFNLIDDLTVEANVELALRYRSLGPDERRQRINEALERVGMSARRRHFPHQLSGGQQQRAAIARAVAGRPSLLLADEPTGNLDSTNGAEVMALLGELHAGGATLIMVTHSAEQAESATRTIRMQDGRIVSKDDAYTLG
jgi:putative ABC transport system ATP-binding protein